MAAGAAGRLGVPVQEVRGHGFGAVTTPATLIMVLRVLEGRLSAHHVRTQKSTT